MQLDGERSFVYIARGTFDCLYSAELFIHLRSLLGLLLMSFV